MKLKLFLSISAEQPFLMVGRAFVIVLNLVTIRYTLSTFGVCCVAGVSILCLIVSVCTPKPFGRGRAELPFSSL